MHHKFVVFGKNIDAKKLVWIGSFNFTKSADIANQESVVVLDDIQTINKFDAQYVRLKERSNNIHEFAKNNFIVQAWHPVRNRYKRKTAVAHAKKVDIAIT
jgi:phosphatidylserine/phosphatidylglycerophosphate/cardiolipin synthase-like enzyme